MSDLLCEDDFAPINFGIFSAEKNGIEFIFQSPMPFDKKRAAQGGCVLFINHEKQPVNDFEDALEKCNEWLRT